MQKTTLSYVATYELATSLFSKFVLYNWVLLIISLLFTPGITLLYIWSFLEASMKTMSTYCCLKKCVLVCVGVCESVGMWGKMLVAPYFSQTPNSRNTNTIKLHV